MTDRIAMLRKQFLEAKPSVSSERLALATEAAQAHAGEPVYLFRAHVFEHVLDNKAVVIRDGELLAGSLTEQVRAACVFPEYNSGKLWLKAELPLMETRPVDPLHVSEENLKRIPELLDWWDGKSTEDIMAEYMPQELKDCENAGVFKAGGRGLCSSWITANFERMFALGFRGNIEHCERKIAETRAQFPTVENQRRIEYWQATIIALEAGIRYANLCADEAERMAAQTEDEARRAELSEMARICRKVPEHSPETFWEAAQFQWFQHLLIHLEANSAATSLGRFDQHMLPYYEHDLANGVSEEFIRELIECLYLKVGTLFYLADSYYSRANAGFPMWQVLNLGGLDADGNDAANDLTMLVLDVTEEMRVAQPPVALRVNGGTPDRFWRKAVTMNQKGCAQPALFNDDVAVKAVMNKGGTLKQARDWAIIGCIEPHPGGGLCDGSPIIGYFNAPKCMEIALHNGVDPVTGMKLGPETGDPKTFTCRQDLIDAVEAQIDYFWALQIRAFSITQSVAATHLPCPYMSVLLDGCIEKGLSIQEGGPELIYANTWLSGSSTVGDSIAAIDYAVFQEKVISMEELIHLCDTNFEGNERMRQYLINKPPKFGNDIDDIDEMVAEIVEHSCRKVQELVDSRGGRVAAGNMSQTHNVTFGEFCGATPDGRKAGTPISDNASPFMGRDVNGPTASCNSVAKLHHEHCHGGTLYNIRFDPKGVEGERGAEILEGLFRTYRERGGFHIQANCVNDEILRAAQEHPEDYRDLVVRVAGYLAYFTELDRTVQESIISRTTHLQG